MKSVIILICTKPGTGDQKYNNKRLKRFTWIYNDSKWLNKRSLWIQIFIQKGVQTKR